jgi:glutaredoxin 3
MLMCTTSQNGAGDYTRRETDTPHGKCHMKAVRIYTTPQCAFCRKAKELLQGCHIPFDEIDLSNDPGLRARLSAHTGWKTVPMIFIRDEFVGGCQELIRLKESGRLWDTLERDQGV